MSLDVINHRGKEILICDFSSYNNQDDLIGALLSLVEYSRNNPHLSTLLCDFTGAFMGPNFMKIGKQNSQLWDKFNSAVVGVDGVKRILLNGYNRIARKKMKAFDSREEALNYLTS